MKPHIFIFDFDGTIADTHLFIVDIYNSFCDEYNYKKIDVKRLEKYKDKNAAQIIRHLKIPIFKIPAMIARFKEIYQNDIEKIKPFPGMKELLVALKSKGHQLAIVSSNNKENITKFLENHGLLIFDFIHPTNRVLSKDSAIKKFVEQHKLDLERIIYIGDEIRDIEAAKKLRIPVIAVTWGYNSIRALKKRRPDHLVHSPEELLEVSTRLDSAKKSGRISPRLLFLRKRSPRL